MENKVRINKYLSSCGLGSRRKVEELVTNGEIEINGEIVTSLSTTLDPSSDMVKHRGKIVTQIERQYYVILNKPKGFITSVSDPFDRPTVMNLIPEKYKRVGIFPVGRLDKDTEGLLLFTNDGDLSQKLMHPKFSSKKEYIVLLEKELSGEIKRKIEKGIYIFGQKTQPCTIEFLDEYKKNIKITISEGKKRQIRRSFSKFQNKVKKLKRISVGPLKIGNLKLNNHRELKPAEIKTLKKYIKNLEG